VVLGKEKEVFSFSWLSNKTVAEATVDGYIPQRHICSKEAIKRYCNIKGRDMSMENGSLHWADGVEGVQG